MSLNVSNGKFARSAKAFFDSVHMGAGLNVGELLRVKGRRRSVSLKEHRGFFPLQEGMIYICQLFLWRYFILKLVMMKVCMAQGPQYREAYLTLQASLIRSTWDPSQTLQGLGHYGLEDLQHQWQVRYATRCGRDPWEGQLGCNKILQCDLGFRVLIRDVLCKFGTEYFWVCFVCLLFGVYN